MPKGIYHHKPLSEKIKIKISETMIGRKFSEEHRKKINEYMRNHTLPQYFRKGHILSDKIREKISIALKGKYMGEKSNNWKGGKMRRGKYILLFKPNNLSATKKGYICEHRFVMEQFLGRPLKKEEFVHHINGIKTDNRIENLQIVGRPHFGKICCPFCQKTFLIK